MDLNARPPWSGSARRRLGDALRAGAAPPAGGPSYADVVTWHDILATEVKNQIKSNSWPVAGELLATSSRRLSTDFQVGSRSKTLDTLVEKLRRHPSLQLNAVQDVAGVRIEADLLLDEQTALAHEVAEHFGAGESGIHDLRDGAHAGYRAVHVWLRFPAGRAEVQIRTALQTLWANAYERLADRCGRGIRYGEPIDQATKPGLDPERVRAAVQTLHDLSATPAATERAWQAGSPSLNARQQTLDLHADAAAEALAFVAAPPTIEDKSGQESG